MTHRRRKMGRDVDVERGDTEENDDARGRIGRWRTNGRRKKTEMTRTRGRRKKTGMRRTRGRRNRTRGERKRRKERRMTYVTRHLRLACRGGGAYL